MNNSGDGNSANFSKGDRSKSSKSEEDEDGDNGKNETVRGKKGHVSISSDMPRHS